jgi:hypothetical protein
VLFGSLEEFPFDFDDMTVPGLTADSSLKESRLSSIWARTEPAPNAEPQTQVSVPTHGGMKVDVDSLFGLVSGEPVAVSTQGLELGPSRSIAVTSSSAQPAETTVLRRVDVLALLGFGSTDQHINTAMAAVGGEVPHTAFTFHGPTAAKTTSMSLQQHHKPSADLGLSMAARQSLLKAVKPNNRARQATK